MKDTTQHSIPASPEAQNNLGILYSSSDSHPRDLEAALKCFRAAAELGHPVAQINLAMMLARGQGAEKDCDQAATWMLRAARQGDASAQFNLGARCQRVNGQQLTAEATEGRIEALMWFQLAAAQGYLKAQEYCNRLRLNMPRGEVAEGSRRAAAFVAHREMPEMR